MYLRQKSFNLIDLELVTYNETTKQKTAFYLWETVDVGQKLKKAKAGLVFANPNEAFESALVDYKEIFDILKKAYNLQPISKSNYRDYINPDFQSGKATPYEQTQIFYLRNYLELYEKSLSYSK